MVILIGAHFVVGAALLFLLVALCSNQMFRESILFVLAIMAFLAVGAGVIRSVMIVTLYWLGK